VHADFEFPDTPFFAPVEVQFTNTSNDFHTLKWDFGNGQSSTELNPTATYDSAGIYLIQLWADGYFDGATDWTDTQSKFVVILNR
jgi:PKD repeat protein